MGVPRAPGDILLPKPVMAVGSVVYFFKENVKCDTMTGTGTVFALWEVS